jgi:hypothetical protein
VALYKGPIQQFYQLIFDGFHFRLTKKNVRLRLKNRSGFESRKEVKNFQGKHGNAVITPGNPGRLQKFPFCLCVRVARFFWLQQTKTGDDIPNNRTIYQMAIKYTKWT